MTGFYVTIIRDRKIGYLAGPFKSRWDAEKAKPNVRRKAIEIDNWAIFDLFGTCKVEADVLPLGVLNNEPYNN